MDETPGSPSDNTTLVEVLEAYRTRGFDANVWPIGGTEVRCDRCSSVVQASDLAVHSLRRLEGASDPDDMVAVAAVTCPACRSNGLLVLGFGPMASEPDSDVLRAVQDRRHDAVLPPASSPDEGDDAGPGPR